MMLNNKLTFLFLILLISFSFSESCLGQIKSVSSDLTIQNINYPFNKNEKFLMQEKLQDKIQCTVNNQKYLNFSNQNLSKGLMNSSWPMTCYNIRHKSLSPYNLSSIPGILKWRSIIGWGGIDGGVSIDKDGVLYFGSNDWYMNAAFPNGTIKWRYHVGHWIETTPAIGSDGTIYAGCWDCYLYAFNPNGTLKWRHHCGSTISYGSPVIADNGFIYVTAMDSANWLMALDSNGSELWRYQTGGYVTSAPAIGPNGAIFFGSADTYIYGLNSNGTLRWRYKTGDRVMGPASIAENGTVYIASWDGYLYALNPINGTLIWRCNIGSGSKINPSIGPNGTIYCGSGSLFAVNPDGTVKWVFSLDSGETIEWSSPAISADGLIFFGTNIGNDGGGRLYAVNDNGTKRWDLILAYHGWCDSSPAIGSDETIYIGTTDDDLGACLNAIGYGPIIADAHGPYFGFYNTTINFNADAFGGIPPYSYHWDFGDGSTSTQQNPNHIYTIIGNMTATLTVTDNEGNQSNDTARVSITYAEPKVIITKPTNGFYILGNCVIPLPRRCIVIGPISVEAEANQYPLGIDRVEFYLDGKLKATDTEAPYTWRWGFGLSAHTIQVIAYDAQGHSASASIQVTKFF